MTPTPHILLPVDQLNESANRYYNDSAAEGGPPVTETPGDPDFPHEILKPLLLSKEDSQEKRIEMLNAITTEPAFFAYERTIGNNDSVYSNFAELIEAAKRKVGRIVIRDGIRITGYATGFMVSERLLLTNWHVFKTAESAVRSEVQFFYELDINGALGSYVSFRFNTADFFFSYKDLDYCLIAVEHMDSKQSFPLSGIGYLFLDPALGKLGREKIERLNIIHHPDGDYMQLSIRENLLVRKQAFTIWYETDTATGSSGAPVFNDQWQVVALHHMGVPATNEAGDYIDKFGSVIPVVNGKIEAAKINWIANEGIRISVMLADLFRRFPENSLIEQMKSAPGGQTDANDELMRPASVAKGQQTRSINQNSSEERKPSNMENNKDGQVNISFPASLIAANGYISIHISNGQQDGASQPAVLSTTKRPPVLPGSPAAAEHDDDDNELDEVKKIEIEDGIDYSSCRGYLPGFLGTGIPMPQPKQPVKKFAVKLTGQDSIVLPYQHYSVILHSERKMPIISAINVDGDKGKRLDKTKRKDVWLRDNRVDYELQLNDAYYKNSGFDRGHMSRREDANWGKTAADALEFANLTCMYSNACPQIKTLNQSKQGGLWGKLENVVLEHGAIKENGKAAKISVFNGAIFNDEDSSFRDIQVPMEFYKIIVWLGEDGKLKATGFRLGQEGLVGSIKFDEALDLDQNVEFKAYRSSIRSIQRDTHIDFSALIPMDTFTGADGGEEAIGEELIEIASEKDVINHMLGK